MSAFLQVCIPVWKSLCGRSAGHGWVRGAGTWSGSTFSMGWRMKFSRWRFGWRPLRHSLTPTALPGPYPPRTRASALSRPGRRRSPTQGTTTQSCVLCSGKDLVHGRALPPVNQQIRMQNPHPPGRARMIAPGDVQIAVLYRLHPGVPRPEAIVCTQSG